MKNSSESNKKPILGPEVGYTDLLDFELIEKIKKDQSNKYFPLRPSSSGYCGRRLAYDLNEYVGNKSYEKPPMDPTVYRLLNLGHSVEYSALKNLENLPGFKLRYKQQVVSLFRLDPVIEDEEAPLIEGSLDVVLWSDNYKCVLDVKSQKDGWSAAYKSRWDETLDKFANMKSLQRIGEAAFYADDLEELLNELNGDFLSDNLYQLNLYACSDFLRDRGVDHAVIYKYGKNDSRHYEIRFRPSLKVYEKTKAKFNNIYRSVIKDKSPEQVERESFLGSARCAFCPYSKTCWDQDALKAFFKTTPKEWPTNIGDNTKELADLFSAYQDLEAKGKEKTKVEQQILKIMEEKKIKKIRLANNSIYEIRFLKTPSPHFELRKGKL